MQNHFHLSFLRLPLILRVFLVTMLFLILFGITIRLVEPKTFHSVTDGIWWAIITATSVGYGDLVPKTLPGRITAVLLILLGAGFVSTYFVTLAATAVSKQNSFLDGKAVYKNTGHFIIIGWNERSREIINQLLKETPPQPIVLIDETLKKNPLPLKHVHYIQGKASVDDTILKSNIHDAKKVLITADQNKDEQQADMNSILTLLSIKGVCPDIPCVVEILTKDQAVNAKRAGADEIIHTNNLLSIFMLSSLASKNNGLIQEVFQHFREQELNVIETDSQWMMKNFTEVGKELLSNGTVLLGIKKGERIFVHPPHTTMIENGDKLIIMKAVNHSII